MVREHHQFNAHEFEQTLGDSGGQRSLEYYSSGGSQRIRHDLATEQQQQWYLGYGTTHKHNGVQNLLIIISVPENMYYIGKVVSVGKVMKNDTSSFTCLVF